MEENLRESYGKAIELLMDGGIDYRKVCITLAKVAPDVFVAACNVGEPLNKEAKIKLEMIAFIRGNPGKKIDAIKRYRDLTGEMLKESKDYVEALEAELSAKSIPLSTRADILALDELVQKFRSGSGSYGLGSGIGSYSDGGAF